MRLFCVCVVLYLGSGRATSWSLIQGVLPSVKNDYKTELEARAPNGLEEPLKNIYHFNVTNFHYILKKEQTD
jgi:hypothetical protein